MTDFDFRVISLRRTPERLATFRRENAHLADVRVFDAFDGATIDRKALIADRTISADLKYLPGALGCALSHRELWREAHSLDRSITICEDDVVLHKHFLTEARSLLDRIPEGWDVVLWGCNLDEPITVAFAAGLRASVTFDPPALTAEALATYVQEPVYPQPFRLLRSFGTSCYTISPRGARQLQNECFPLRPFLLPMGGVRVARNVGVDVAMCGAYARSNVWIAFPPLAVAVNDKATSTIGSDRR